MHRPRKSFKFYFLFTRQRDEGKDGAISIEEHQSIIATNDSEGHCTFILCTWQTKIKTNQVIVSRKIFFFFSSPSHLPLSPRGEVPPSFLPLHSTPLHLANLCNVFIHRRTSFSFKDKIPDDLPPKKKVFCFCFSFSTHRAPCLLITSQKHFFHHLSNEEDSSFL
jgi:hypothetical protein